MDILDLMSWARDECRRRGCDDPNAQMRKMHDARRKAATGMPQGEVQREIIEELRVAGFLLPGEQTIEERIAEQERANPTKVQMWRSNDTKGAD